MGAEQHPVSLSVYRERQSRSRDARSTRTRARILDAFERLSERGGEVTVSAVVREAGIGRASFYTHFAGVAELASAVQGRVVERISAWQILEAHRDGDAVDHEGSLEMATRMLVRYFARRRALYARILGPEMPSQVSDQLVDALAEAVEDFASHVGAKTPEAMLHLQATCIAGGVATVLTRWVRGELACGEDELVHVCLALLPKWLHREAP